MINWAEEQDQDKIIAEVENLLSKTDPDTSNISPGAKKLWKKRESLSFVGGVSSRIIMCSGEEQKQLVLPRKYCDCALNYVQN